MASYRAFSRGLSSCFTGLDWCSWFVLLATSAGGVACSAADPQTTRGVPADVDGDDTTEENDAGGGSSEMPSDDDVGPDDTSSDDTADDDGPSDDDTSDDDTQDDVPDDDTQGDDDAADDDVPDDDTGSEPIDDEPSGDDTADDDVFMGDDTMDFIEDSPDVIDENECSGNCSNDLRSVLNCGGNVVESCENGDACLDGECVEDACAVADESQSSIGCEYWTFKPDAHWLDSAVSCLAVFVTNTWSVPVKVDVSFQGEALTDTRFIRIPRGQGADLSYDAYDPEVGIPVGEVAILFLADVLRPLFPGCPVAPAIREQVGVFGTDIGQGFHIQTSDPVSVYSVVPYGGGSGVTTSASLLLPTSRWGLEYVAVSAYPESQIGADSRGVPTLNVLAKEDDTSVSILPKVAITGQRWELSPEGYPVESEENTVASAMAGEAVTYVLNRGEHLQISQSEELTGSPIVADKPVGVWGGSTCMNIPVDTVACDGAHQQIPPVQALGNEYVGVRYRNRVAAAGVEEAPPWRIVGAVAGTELEWLPNVPEGAPLALQAGEVYEFWHTGPFVVRSQDEDHPFYLGQYMTGAKHLPGEPGIENPEDTQQPPQEGDPEWVNVVPTAQYLKRYVFLTDPTYPETSLVVVRRRRSGGATSPVTLDCAGELQGWEAIGSYEYTRVDLVTGQYENVGDCSNGVHEMTSDDFFSVTVWGWGTAGTSPSSSYVSYAYPAGVGLRTVNQVALPPIRAQ